MLDQRGQLLRAAVGFAGCALPLYDRALRALRAWLDSWSGIGRPRRGRHGAPGLRSPAHAVRRAGLARDVLHITGGWVTVGLIVGLLAAGLILSTIGGWWILMSESGWTTPRLVLGVSLTGVWVAIWVFIGFAWLKLRSLTPRVGRRWRWRI